MRRRVLECRHAGVIGHRVGELLARHIELQGVEADSDRHDEGGDTV